MSRCVRSDGVVDDVGGVGQWGSVVECVEASATVRWIGVGVLGNHSG
jgi:hypothetical protein